MNWTTVLTSIASSALVAGLISFILKIWIQERIKDSFESRRQRYGTSLSILGDLRKSVTSEQVELYKHAVSLVYRIRNTCREQLAAIESGTTTEPTTDQTDQPLIPLRFEFHRELMNLIYDNRALLHEEAFFYLIDPCITK